MKILKWRIFTREQIDRIVKMIDGIPEDREIAKNLMLHHEDPGTLDFPRFRIEVTPSRVNLHKKEKPDKEWTNTDGYYYSTKQEKENLIKRYTRKAEQLKEEERIKVEETYYINL